MSFTHVTSHVFGTAGPLHIHNSTLNLQGCLEQTCAYTRQQCQQFSAETVHVCQHMLFDSTSLFALVWQALAIHTSGGSRASLPARFFDIFPGTQSGRQKGVVYYVPSNQASKPASKHASNQTRK